MVEIAKAFRADLSVLILDEPTASLTDRETERLFALIEQAKSEGVGIIYVTHRMSEIRHIGDRVTVLRDGKRMATLDVAKADDERLLRADDRTRHQPGISRRSRIGPGGRCSKYRATHHRRPSGPRTFRYGSRRRDRRDCRTGRLAASRRSGAPASVWSGWRPAALCSTAKMSPDARRARCSTSGLFYLPPDRREEGLVMMRSVRENISLPCARPRPFSRFGFLDRGSERGKVREVADRLNLQPRNIERDLERLSGGNQQKVLLAKALVSRGEAVHLRRADRRRRCRHARRHLRLHSRSVRERRRRCC